MFLPSARRQDLTVRELADETVVYDHRVNKAHCLNRTTAFIWRHCDGSISVSDLANRVQKEIGIAQAEPVVRLALEQLSRRDLLLQAVPPTEAPAVVGRRSVLKKIAAVATLPLALTVSARPARAESAEAAASCGAICLYDGNGRLKSTIVAGGNGSRKCRVKCPSVGPSNGSSIVQGRME